MGRADDLMQRTEDAYAAAMSRLATELGLPDESDALDGISGGWFSGFAFAAAEWSAWMAEERAKRPEGDTRIAAAADAERLAKELGLPEDPETLDALRQAWKTGARWMISNRPLRVEPKPD